MNISVDITSHLITQDWSIQKRWHNLRAPNMPQNLLYTSEGKNSILLRRKDQINAFVVMICTWVTFLPPKVKEKYSNVSNVLRILALAIPTSKTIDPFRAFAKFETDCPGARCLLAYSWGMWASWLRLLKIIGNANNFWQLNYYRLTYEQCTAAHRNQRTHFSYSISWI